MRTSRLEELAASARRALHSLGHPSLRRKPRALLRSLGLMGRTLLDGRPRLWFVNLSITNDCNLNCQHCFAARFREGADASSKPRLSTPEYVAVIRELVELGVVAFEFQGGEVFLRPDFDELVRACEPQRSYVSIVSNGLLLGEENLEKLWSCGVDQLNISMDSGIPEEHDRFRGLPGTWEKAARAVDLGRRRGFKVTVFTTVTHDSLHGEGFSSIREFCRERGVVLWILIGIPVGNWAGQDEVLIDEQDHAYLEQLCRESRGLVRRDLSTRYFTSGCPSVSESFYLDPYGELLPCPFIHASLGNVRDHRVRDILDRALTLEKFRTNSPVCLIGEDRDFIARYGRRTFTAERIPVTDDVFAFPEPLPPRPGPLGRPADTEATRHRVG